MSDNEDQNPLNINIDFEKIKENIDKYSSEKLCAMIVSNRYLRINNEISVFCMEELGKRRANGENFQYEDYIENAYKELPTIELSSLMDSIKIFSNVASILKGKK